MKAFFRQQPWPGYTLPFICWLAGKEAGYLAPAYQALCQLIGLLLAAGCLITFYKRIPDLQPKLPLSGPRLLAAVTAGLLSGSLYLILPAWQWRALPPPAAPYAEFPPTFAGQAAAALLITLTAICLPVVLELFWRGFMLRYLIQPEFSQLPAGTLSAVSLMAVLILSALLHAPLPATIANALILCLLWRYSANLKLCIVAQTLAVWLRLAGHFPALPYW